MTFSIKRQHQALSLPSDFSTHEAAEVTFTKQPPRQCTECGAKVTPQWRQGPQGPQTLCNACGVRYSRLHRKVKTPKRQLNDSPASSKEEHEEELEDSDGMTIFNGSSAAAHTSPASTPSRAGTVPASSPGAFQATSSVRPTRAVRTTFGALAAFTAAATTTPNSSRRSSSGSGSLAPSAKDRATLRNVLPEYDLDCEAANLLLSMAQGEPCRDGSQQAPASRRAAAPAAATTAAAQVAAEHGATLEADVAFEQAQRQLSTEALSPEQQADPKPCLQPGEVRALQQLCGMFDERFKDLVAARAACDAVARVLRLKQEEARVAQAAARSAAQLLMVHAAALSSHEVVLRALAAAQSSHQDKPALAVEQAETCDPAATKTAPVTAVEHSADAQLAVLCE